MANSGQICWWTGAEFGGGGGGGGNWWDRELWGWGGAQQVLKKSEEWSLRRCDSKFVTVLSKGVVVISKIAIWWPYKSTDQNCFQGDTSRVCKLSIRFLLCFDRKCDNRKNPRQRNTCRQTWTKVCQVQLNYLGYIPDKFKIWKWSRRRCNNKGSVVQSVVSLTSSLRVISLTVLADSIHNILIFFAEKMWVAFALQKLLTFFQQKISAYLHITQCKF